MDVIINAGLTSMVNCSEIGARLCVLSTQDQIDWIIKHNKGLRDLYDKQNVHDFVAFLITILYKKEMELHVQVMFDSFSMDDSKIPHILYQLGFSHRIDQHLINVYNSSLMTFLETMNCFQNLPEECVPIMPELKHSPLIDWHLGKHLPRKIRSVRKKTFHVKDSNFDKFYLYIGSANICLRCQRWFEAWTYSLSALDVSMDIYKSKVLCQIAISSANIGCDPIVTWKALGEAYYSVEMAGQQWEWMVSLVQVLVAFGLFEEEEQVFEHCKQVIPVMSSWFESLVTHHVNGLTQQVENMIAKQVIINHMRELTVISFDNLSKISTTIDKIKHYASLLTIPGAKTYYNALQFFYKSMIQSDESFKKKYYNNGKLQLLEARKELESNDIRKMYCLQLLICLDNQMLYLDFISDVFREHTRTDYSTVGSEFWIKCVLLSLCNKVDFKKFWLGPQAMANEAFADYNKATFSQGYRLPTFKYLKEYYKPTRNVHKKIPEVQTVLEKASEDFTKGYLDRSDNNLSKGYIHLCQYGEQAYMVGMNICNSKNVFDAETDVEE